jgi:parallel beta-helix repeat protein
MQVKMSRLRQTLWVAILGSLVLSLAGAALAEGEETLAPKIEKEVKDRCDGRRQLVLQDRQGRGSSFESPVDAFRQLADGDVLFICPGVYEVASPLVVSKLSTVGILGYQASIVSPIDSPILQIEDSNSIGIAGLHVIHQTGEWCSQNTVEVSNSKDVEISFSDLDGSGFYAVAVSSSTDVTLKGNLLHNSQFGLGIWNSPGLTLRDNKFRDNTNNFDGDVKELLTGWYQTNDIGPEIERTEPSGLSQKDERCDIRTTRDGGQIRCDAGLVCTGPFEGIHGQGNCQPVAPAVPKARAKAKVPVERLEPSLAPGYQATCPQWVEGCSPSNLCTRCDRSCGSYCQDTGESDCGTDDCMSCPTGTRLSVIYGDGTGECLGL